MACAGYLVLESATPVFVEVSMGVLFCRRASPEGTPPGDATSEELARALPTLEPRRMDRREASPTCSQRQKMEALGAQPVAQAGGGREGVEDGVERVLQLSGLVVDVLEREEELDVPSLPGSFQVMTYKVSREPDGSTSSALRDSLILTAKDEASRALWIKRIKHWNRFGWRETQAITAEQEDLAALEAMVRRFRQTAGERSEKLCASLRSSSSAPRKHRRRFYRATSHAPFIPPP